MQVREIMSRKMVTIQATTTIREAARKMRALNLGSLPVLDGSELIGIITDRDICCRAVGDGIDTVRTSVREIMSPHVEFCFSDEDVTAAVKHMSENHVRRLAVLNRDKSVAGFLTVDDLAHYSNQLAGEVLDAMQSKTH